MLDRAQIEFYREQGYLLVEDVLDEALLAAASPSHLRHDRAFAGGRGQRRDLRSGRGPLGGQPAADPDQVAASSTCRASTRCSTHRRSRPCCRQLLGQVVRLQTTKLNTKAPGGGAAVEWHQDWAFYPHTNDDLLAIGLMLEDVDDGQRAAHGDPRHPQGAGPQPLSRRRLRRRHRSRRPAVRARPDRDAHRPRRLDDRSPCPAPARFGPEYLGSCAADLLLRMRRRRRLAVGRQLDRGRRARSAADLGVDPLAHATMASPLSARGSRTCRSCCRCRRPRTPARSSRSRKARAQ